MAEMDKAKNWLAEAGYSPMFGARPLKRVIQRELENRLAVAILNGKINLGDQCWSSEECIIYFGWRGEIW